MEKKDWDAVATAHVCYILFIIKYIWFYLCHSSFFHLTLRLFSLAWGLAGWYVYYLAVGTCPQFLVYDFSDYQSDPSICSLGTCGMEVYIMLFFPMTCLLEASHS